MKKHSPQAQESPPTYAERLQFVIWYAVLETGIEGATKLSKAMGKGGNTISKWATKQPSFDQSEILADVVGVNATWLHNPKSSGAVEPELFAKWLRKTRAAAGEIERARRGKRVRGKQA